MKCPYCGQHNDSDVDRCVYCKRSLRRIHKEHSIILNGMIAIVFILLLGSASFIFASGRLDMSLIDENTINNAIAETNDNNQQPATENGGEQVQGEETEGNTDAPALPSVTGALVDGAQIREVLELQGFSRVGIANAVATSTTPAEDGSDYYGAHSAVDDSDATSWQEGADGQGVGEQLILQFDREYGVKYIFLKLGCWTSQDSYFQNNRPETLTFTIGDSSFSVSFPDQMQEYCVEITGDVTTSQLTIQIENAYVGSAWDDTCITNVEVAGY